MKYDCLEPLGLSVTRTAAILGVTRPTLSKVVNGHAAVSPEMAIRLSKAFGSRPEAWLRMQLAYDLARAQQLARGINVKRYTRRNAERHERPE